MLSSVSSVSYLTVLSSIVAMSCVSLHHRNDQGDNGFSFHSQSYANPHSLTRRMAYGLLLANPAPMQIAALSPGFMPQNYLGASPDQGAGGMSPYGPYSPAYGAAMPNYASQQATQTAASNNAYAQSLSNLISPLFGTSSYSPFISSIFGRR